jgi:hypothetical protein
MKLAERIAFYLLLALIIGPCLGYVVFWMLDVTNVGYDEDLIEAHIAGIIGMIAWCVLFLKPNPRNARTGLIVCTLFLAFWAYALFS